MDVWEQFKNSHNQSALIKNEMLEKLYNSLLFFNKRSIDVLLLKMSPDDLLQGYWLGTSNDIDLVIRRRREDVPEREHAEIKTFLQSLGRNELGHSYFELEYFEHHDVTMLGILPVNFQRIWNDAHEIDYRGQKVFMMSQEDLLLAICINSARKRYFRLKSLFDIVTLIKNTSGFNWDEFIKKAHEYKCNSIVYTAFLVAKLTVGCELPPNWNDFFLVDKMKTIFLPHFVQYVVRNITLYSLHPHSNPGVYIFGLKVNLETIVKYTIHFPQLIRYLYSQRLNFKELSDITRYEP
jgi:hypothetical protein